MYFSGEIAVFDDSFEHVPINSGKTQLVLLSLEFHHPDLKDEEKKMNSLSDHLRDKFAGF